MDTTKNFKRRRHLTSSDISAQEFVALAFCPQNEKLLLTLVLSQRLNPIKIGRAP